LVAVCEFIYPPATIKICCSFDIAQPNADLAHSIDALNDISCDSVIYFTVEKTLELWISEEPPIRRQAIREIGITLDK